VNILIILSICSFIDGIISCAFWGEYSIISKLGKKDLEIFTNANEEEMKKG
jgi:hypothetical protein